MDRISSPWIICILTRLSSRPLLSRSPWMRSIIKFKRSGDKYDVTSLVFRLMHKFFIFQPIRNEHYAIILLNSLIYQVRNVYVIEIFKETKYLVGWHVGLVPIINYFMYFRKSIKNNVTMNGNLKHVYCYDHMMYAWKSSSYIKIPVPIGAMLPLLIIS